VKGGKTNQFSSSNMYSFIKEKKRPKILEEQSSFMDMPDDIFDRILLKAFPNARKLAQYLNGKNKIDFARCYADLLGYLSYLKLQQDQWDYNHQIGMTQHIWTNHVPKHVAEKNSMVHAYGRSRREIEQRLIQFQQKLPHVQHDIQQFEQRMLFQSVPNIDYSSELDSLSSIVHTFVHENQQELRGDFENKRQMLILDATDHRLVRSFFDLKPNKGQVRTERNYFVTLDELL
jgi:hypothetical protein